MREYNYSAIWTGAVTAFAIWVSSMAGGLTFLNSWAYDTMTRMDSEVEASSSILLIEASAARTKDNDHTWLPVLKGLLRLKPREIVFTFLPDRTSAEFYKLARNSKRVVFGRQILRAGTNGEQISLEPLPKGLAGIKVPYGIVVPGFGHGGTVRQQKTQMSIDGKQWPSLARVAVKHGFKESRIVPDQTFYVNFMGGTDRLPKVTLDWVLSNGLIPELVRDRVVVIGDLDPPDQAWLVTPLSRGDEMMRTAHFQGFALDTLISNRVINLTGSGGVLLILLLITMIFLFVYQWISIRVSLWATVLVLCTYSIATWFFLHFLAIWLPFAEMVLAQCTMFFAVTRRQAVREESTINKMVLNLSGLLKEKAFPTSVYQASDPWGPIITMVNQILHLNRVIFLERVEGDHRLREIRALNCSVDDIDERRRDYERTPYSTAISEDGPIQVSRNYLKAIDGDEQQFLAPLIYAGDILGFWAFGIEPEKLKAIPEFTLLTKTFSFQISEILHNRQLWQDHHRKQENKLLSYMRFEGGDTPSNSLIQSITKRERRTSEVYEVFNHLSSASILYDLFGRVVLVNKQMEEHAAASNLKPYNLSLLEFIAGVTGCSVSDSRRQLQSAAIDQENVTIPVIGADGEKTHILHLKPVQTQQTDSWHANQELEEAHPFRLTGILCELVDVAEITAVVSVMEQVYERVSEVTVNDLDAVIDSLTTFKINDSSKKKLIQFFDMTQKKLTQTAQVLKHLKTEASSTLSRSSDKYSYENTPVDGASSLVETVDRVRKEVADQNISIRIQTPKLLCLVIASSQELKTGFGAILMLMAKDTVEQGKVRAVVQQKDDYIFFQFSNDGFGIPDERLQEYLQHDGEAVSDEMRKLRQLKRHVYRWGGRIDITSKVGKGLRIDLSLQRFI